MVNGTPDQSDAQPGRSPLPRGGPRSISGGDPQGVALGAPQGRARPPGVCPACRERPIRYEVLLRGVGRLVACSECWPELESQLRADGVQLVAV